MSEAPYDFHEDFFQVRNESVVTGEPLPTEIYLLVSGNPLLFRKQGDIITEERLAALREKGAKHFLVPNDQRAAYFQNLNKVSKDTGASLDVRSKAMKESAFVHVEELFTNKDLKPVISNVKGIVGDMVDFIHTNLGAAASLLTLSNHDYYTFNHSVDVAVYSIALMNEIGGGDKDKVMLAGFGGFLHDLGKKDIDPAIINKPGKLTREEWEIIKTHPSVGYNHLKDVPGIPKEVLEIVYQHHENYNGTGYPQGLKGEEISELARVVSIADVFDAITTNRSYDKAKTPSEALDIMCSLQPGKFDPVFFKDFNRRSSVVV